MKQENKTLKLLKDFVMTSAQQGTCHYKAKDVIKMLESVSESSYNQGVREAHEETINKLKKGL